MMHPVYHGFHSEYCQCLDASKRLGFLQANPSTNANSTQNMLFLACVPNVDEMLYLNWVYLPGIMYFLVNILLLIAQRDDHLRSWLTRKWNPHQELKHLHHPGNLVFDGKRARIIQPGEPWYVSGSTFAFKFRSSALQMF